MENLEPLTTIGVVADTHLPDRHNKLPEGLLPGLAAARVKLILHAGDITSPLVLELLKEIAPVVAVKGNRDWALKLPLIYTLDEYGVRIGLAHGHGGLKPYLLDKVQQILHGYRFERYRDQLLDAFLHPTRNSIPAPQIAAALPAVIIFGHTHVTELRQENGILFFNPGAAIPCLQNNFKPRYGLLRIYAEGKVVGESIEC
jgi:predicted phosphodiesterase